MSDLLSVQVSFDAATSFESVLVTQLDSGIYRLEETPLASETTAIFGDVIEVVKDESGRLIFHRIISKAEFQICRWAVSRQLLETPEFKVFCNSVVQLGGMWELAIGGYLIVHIPRDANFNSESEIERITQIVGTRP